MLNKLTVEVFMEEFDLLKNSRAQDFIRFLLALCAGVMTALVTVVFLGILSL